VRGAIAPRGLELQLHLPGGVELHPLVRQRRPGDGAAQLFQPLAVMGLDSHRGVQAEAVDVGAQGLARRSLARHCTSRGEGQHLLPGAGPEGDAIRHSRRLQRSQRACLFAFGLRLGQPGLAHVFHQHAPAREQRHQPGDDGLQQRVQLVVGRGTRLDEGWHTVGATAVHAVQYQAMQVDVEVGGRAEARESA
jgi:hypothetical protein